MLSANVASKSAGILMYSTHQTEVSLCLKSHQLANTVKIGPLNGAILALPNPYSPKFCVKYQNPRSSSFLDMILTWCSNCNTGEVERGITLPIF